MKKKNRMHNLLAIILAMVVVFVSSTQVSANPVRKTNAGGTSSAEEVKEKVFVGDGFTVKYSISSQWGDKYNADVVITNTGDKTIENWELGYESSDEYSNIWNAKIAEHSARIYDIKNAGWNQNIEPNQSVSFGFQASFSGSIDIPTSYKLIGEKTVVSSDDCNVTFNIENQWGTGCIMDVTLNNVSDEDIEDWSLQFDFGFEVTNIWKAKIESHEGSVYNLKNCGYNSVISAGSSTTFGMQVSFKEGETLQCLTNAVVSQFNKGKWYVDFDTEWNRQMIHADSDAVLEARKKNKNTIKVGLIDSGVGYSTNVNVVERANFVTGYEDTNPLFDDISGHGTAIAGLMASDSTKSIDVSGTGDPELEKLMNEKIDGVNPYVKIYSARVLDESNEADVNNIIAGINWAIDKKVNIINLSCGINKDVPALHEVIKKAYNDGILIIAAAGNDSEVEYPAKYDEVMAVGSVKCTAKKADDSATGDKIEVVAPGQDVTSYGPFGIVDDFSGSSMAAPQVTALAAILWQQDPSKSNEFIRQLIDVSANNLGDKSKYGYGLIDCENALQKYSDFSSTFLPSNSVEENVDGSLESGKIEVNDNSLLCVDEDKVKGFWGKDDHRNMVGKTYALRKGCIWPDKKASTVQGMGPHPQFHGYWKKNYVAAYIFMIKEAKHIYAKGEVLKSKKDLVHIDKSFINSFNKAFEKGIKEYSYTSEKDKGYFAYGMAMHTLADTFAHNAYCFNGGVKGEYKGEDPKGKWKKIRHGDKDKDKNYINDRADNPRIPKSQIRYKSAFTVVSHVVAKVLAKKKPKHPVGTVMDYIGVKYVKLYMGTDKDKRKSYIEKAYGIKDFEQYIGNTTNKELKKIIDNVDNDNILDAFKKW